LCQVGRQDRRAVPEPLGGIVVPAAVPRPLRRGPSRCVALAHCVVHGQAALGPSGLCHDDCLAHTERGFIFLFCCINALLKTQVRFSQPLIVNFKEMGKWDSMELHYGTHG
jgi:hypothetical protein